MTDTAGQAAAAPTVTASTAQQPGATPQQGETAPQGDTTSQQPDGTQAGTAPTTQQTPEAQPQVDPRLTEQFAALMRKDRSVSTRERAIKESEKELAELREFKKLLADSPLEAIKKAGLKFESLADTYLNKGKPTTDQVIESLQQELKSVKEQLAAQDDAKEKAKHEEAIKGVKDEITNYVKTSQGYELIQAEGAYDLVYDVMAEHAQRTREEYGDAQVLDTKEACDIVEKYLLDERSKLASVSKLADIFKNGQAPQGEKPPEQAANGPQASQGQPQSTEPTTLTSQQAATAPVPNQPKLTKEESVASAAKLLKFTAQ